MAMPLWVLLLLLAMIKVPLAALMIWIPLRSDEAMSARQDSAAKDAKDDDGGSKTLPGSPRDPHPRRPLPVHPRRGPHGERAPGSPARVRHGNGRPAQVPLDRR